MFTGVGVTKFNVTCISYSLVSCLYVSFSGLIIPVEDRANVSAIVYCSEGFHLLPCAWDRLCHFIVDTLGLPYDTESGKCVT